MLGKVPRENGLADSLLVRLHNLYSELPGAVFHQSKLLINYRCHPAIVRLPSRLFYDCRIQVCVCLRACVCVCVLIRTYCVYVGTCVYVHVFVFACVCTHMLTNAMQTAAEVVPHPEWDKMVYFVCSSLQLKEPGAGSKGTQEELLHETCAPNEAERTCKPTSPVGQFFLTVGIHTLQP